MTQHSKFDINKTFVSVYDKFLKAFDKTHDVSAAQKKEIEKHERIARLRDQGKRENQ